MLLKNSRVLYRGNIIGTVSLRNNLSRRILREKSSSYIRHYFYVITNEIPLTVLIWQSVIFKGSSINLRSDVTKNKLSEHKQWTRPFLRNAWHNKAIITEQVILYFSMKMRNINVKI